MKQSPIAGRYSRVREIGRGGMGVVWLGQDELLGRAVAIKRIGQPPGTSGDDLARAEREARTAASLNHPHVVSVYDLVTDQDQRWLVMEYVDGSNLNALITRKALGPDDAAALLVQVADALVAAHKAGVVHRDVKPSNILVDRNGSAKLADFGIARMHADPSLTQTGLVTGSPAYLAPEVASGGASTAASDVWALGATLFHVLSGTPPYDVQGNVLGAMYRIVHEDTPRLDNAGWLAPLLEATMEKDPKKRWSMTQVRNYLAAGNPSGATGTVPLPPVVVPVVVPEPQPTRRAPEPTQMDSAPPAQRGTTAPVPTTKGRAPTARILATLLVLAIVGTLGWLALRNNNDNPGSAKTPGPGTSSTPSASTDPQADAMIGFVQTYLQTVVDSPKRAWDRLTPDYQTASGGFGSYNAFWRPVDSASATNLSADIENLTVSYDVTYLRDGVESEPESVTLQLVPSSGSFLIAGQL